MRFYFLISKIENVTLLFQKFDVIFSGVGYFSGFRRQSRFGGGMGAVAVAREIAIQGEGDGTACAVVNQLWVWLFTNSKKIFFNAPTANSTVG